MMNEELKMVKKTLAGCVVNRSFMLSPDGQDFGLMMKLMNEGYKELYYSAPYYWGLANPDEKKVVNYTEGDVDRIICPDKKTFVSELENQLGFVKDNYSNRVVWAEGEDLLKKIKD